MSRPTLTRSARPRFVLVLAAFLLLITGPTARASERASASRTAVSSRARDVAATRAYIQANYRLVRFSRANLDASRAAVRALVRQTVTECPLAGEGSYANRAANQVSEEIIGTIVTTAFRPDVAAIDAFTGAVAHLRWSSRTLTRSVHGYVLKLENLAALAPAAVCDDVKAFAVASFLTAPEATVRFDKLYHAADVEAEEVSLRLLAAYEDPRDTALLRRTKKLEAPIAEAEADAVEEWMAIMRGLALSI
jgi:hypothetical protein